MRVSQPASGVRLAYAEITADFTTTAVFTSSTTPPAGSSLDALAIQVTGTGRPIAIRGYFPLVRHSTANQPVYVQFAVDGVKGSAGGGSAASSSASVGRSLYVAASIVIAVGVTKTITPIVMGGAAGTTTLNATTDGFPAWCKAVTE